MIARGDRRTSHCSRPGRHYDNPRYEVNLLARLLIWEVSACDLLRLDARIEINQSEITK
jgi:hypothetical protein